MKRIIYPIIAVLLAISQVAQVRGADITYITGDTLYTYSTQSKPAKGGSYVDSTYNTTIYRATNSVSDNGDWGMSCGYSTWTPLNYDGTHVLFRRLGSNTSGYPQPAVYDVSGDTYSYNATASGYMSTYVLGWNSQDPEPRWDMTGSNVHRVYYRKNAQLRYVDIDTGTDGLVHDFASMLSSLGFGSSYYIYNGEEGAPSDDGRYWAFIARNSSSPYYDGCYIVYDLTTDSVIATKVPSGNQMANNIMMSKGGNYVYVSYDWTGAGNEYDGPHIYSRNFSSNVKCCSGIPHAVWAYDAQGREVVFYLMSDYISFTRADNGNIYHLYAQVDMGWDGSNTLFTTPNVNKKGWGFVSTYSSTGGNNHWSDNQVFAIELDETKTYGSANEPTIWRISFTQNQVGTDYYFQQPNAQIDPSGTRIWWGANWRSDGDNIDVYYCKLPTNWYTDLGGGTPSSPDITTTSLPNGEVGTAYSQSLSATGGTAPYTWSIVSGSLPTGLSLNSSTGAITGTPTASQTASITFRCTDANSLYDQQAIGLTITVTPSGGGGGVVGTKVQRGGKATIGGKATLGSH